MGHMVPILRDALCWILWAPQQPGAAPPPEPPVAAAPAPVGLASAYPGDRGLAGHPSVRFTADFEDGLRGFQVRHRGIFTVVDDRQFAHGGQRCVQATATRGVDHGGEITLVLPKGEDRLFVRFYCRFAEDTVWPHHFVKLRALAKGFDGEAGKAPPGDQGFWTGIEPLRGTWRFYTYWHAMRGWNNPGPVPGRNDDGTETTAANDFYGNSFTPDGQDPVPKDRWICVEAMLQANTVGKHDGAMAFWIDGKEVGRYGPGVPVGCWRRNVFVTSGPNCKDPRPFSGFDFRTVPELKVNEVALLWYVSDEYAAKGTAERNRVWFDDVVVATEYIGPKVDAKAK